MATRTQITTLGGGTVAGTLLLLSALSPAPHGAPALGQLLAPAPLAAQDGAAAFAVTGTLRVDGGSTVRSWSCEASTLDVRIDANPGASLTSEGVAAAVRALQVAVPTARMDCDNDTMNDHMWNALERDRHPEIRFRMARYTATPAEAGALAIRLEGELDMTGQTHPVTLELRGTPHEGGLQITGTHTLNMTRWGIRPPRLMLGTLRVHEEVTLHLDLTLRPR